MSISSGISSNRVRAARAIAWCVAAACMLATLPASAANYTWTNATTGTFNWDTTTNWSGSTVPVNGDTGTIFINNRAASYTVTFNPLTSQTFTSSTTTNGLQVGGGSGSGTVTFSLAQGNLTLKNGSNGQSATALALNGGGVFNLSGSGTLNSEGLLQASGVYDQSGGVANFTSSPFGTSRFYFGNSAVTSTNTLSGGAMNVNTTAGAAGLKFGITAGADLLFLINGGTMTQTGTSVSTTIGERGAGTVRITSGGFSHAAALDVGPQSLDQSASTSALLDVQGGAVTNAGLLRVGQSVRSASSTARVTQSGGSFTQSGDVNLGISNSGSITLSGGTFAFTGSTFQLGSGTLGQLYSGSAAAAAGVGVLTISNGLFTGTNSGSTSVINVGRTANDGANTGNLMSIAGGTATVNTINVYRGGTFSVSSGSATVNRTLQISGTAGTGGGLGQVSGGFLSVTNSATNAALTIEKSGTFQVTGGSVTANVFTGTAAGGSLLVQGGTMSVNGSLSSSQPITVGGGSGVGNLALVGSSTSYNSTVSFNFTGGTAAGITIQNNGLVSSQGRLSFNSPIVIQSGGTMSLASAAGAATNGINDGQLVVDTATGSLAVQAGGVFSARSAALQNGARLNVSGGQFTMTRAAGDVTSELRFTGTNTGFVVSSGTLSMTSTSSAATLLRLGGVVAGATSGTLSGGAMSLSQFVLGDRGGTFAGDSAADATFTMTGGTLSLDNVQGGGLYVGNNPQTTTTPFNRGFFNQSGGATTNSGVLQIGVNTQGAVSLGSFTLSGGTFSQAGVTQVGVSGSGTGVSGTLAVSGGRFSTTGAFFVGGTSSTYNVGGAVSVTGSGLFTGTNAGRNVTVSVSRVANDATAGNNTFLVNGGTATIDVLNVYRSGTFTVSAGQATVNSALLLSGTAAGGGAGRLTGGTLLVQSGSNTATFTVGQNASFVQSGGSATVDSATITAAGASFALQAGTFTSGSFAATQPVTIDGTLNLNAATASIGSLSGVGTIGRSAVGSGTVSIGDATNSTFAGSITNALGTLGLTKAGAGVLTLTGTSSYTGATAVNAGSLLVNGQLGSTAVTVNADGKLGGSGAILGAVTNNGLLSPGNSPGVLSVASLVLGGSGTVLMEITGTTAGTQFDQVSLTGALAYGGVLQLDLSQTFADNTSFNLFTGFTSESANFSSVTSVGSAYNGLTFTRTGDLWTSGTAAGNQSLEFNQATGTLVIVPEPGALALAGLGIAAAAWTLRRRK